MIGSLHRQTVGPLFVAIETALCRIGDVQHGIGRGGISGHLLPARGARWVFRSILTSDSGLL
jgi:hypothetical protein